MHMLLLCRLLSVPPGWNMAGTGKLSDPASIAGSLSPADNSNCRSPPGSKGCRGPAQDKLVPCDNIPTVFQALEATGSLGTKNMFSIYMNQDTSANGELQAAALGQGPNSTQARSKHEF
jgi:hypothetical protein